jgi:DNA-binding transcriptional ArsR family regulator
MADPRKSDQPIQLYQLTPRDKTVGAVRPHDCVLALRALAEDTRVRIVGLLIDEPLDVGEISRRLKVSQYNVTKHLRILREAGLLDVERNGRSRLYALPETMRGRAATGSVLDLGCCSFQFQGAAKEDGGLASGRPPLKRPARPGRAAR